MDNVKRLGVGVVVIAFIALAIFLLVSPWGRDTDDQIIDPDHPSNLLQYKQTDVQMRLTIRGRIVSEQEHRQLEITVGRDRTVMHVYQGYQERIIESGSHSNNPDAYEVFLAALMNLDFTDTRDVPEDVEVLGACPRQNQYFFEILDGDEVIHESWSSQCSAYPGDFGGDLSDTVTLFKRQIPDYNQLVRDVRL